MDIFCKTKDLKVYQTVESDTEEFVKLVTLATGDVYDVPLFVAFHLPLFMAPSDSRYMECLEFWSFVSILQLNVFVMQGSTIHVLIFV